VEKVDLVIVGAGIVGMAIADRLKQRSPGLDIAILDKESDVAQHASGRNSGVLHAGFYYTADSLKARLTVAGNTAMREFCQAQGIGINECGKLVVATNRAELKQLKTLEARGQANGSAVSIISAAEAERIEPNVRTYEQALWSPRTATVDPKEVCLALKSKLLAAGVRFFTNTKALSIQGSLLHTDKGSFAFGKLVNCAGLYADRLAQQCGFGKDYIMIPFKGLYLKYPGNPTNIKTNIYPVPNLKNPFLGVHFTVTKSGLVKLGPTATPALWRENYRGLDRFSFRELVETLSWESLLFVTNAFGFRNLAFEEMQKYRKRFFVDQARKLVKEMDDASVGDWSEPGIRAQLLNKKTKQLVQDFIVEGDSRSVHILNAVSPGFTCSFPFAEYVIEKYLT